MVGAAAGRVSSKARTCAHTRASFCVVMRVDACMRDHVMRDSCMRAFVYGGLVGPVAVPSVHSIGCDRVSQLRTLVVTYSYN